MIWHCFWQFHSLPSLSALQFSEFGSNCHLSHLSPLVTRFPLVSSRLLDIPDYICIVDSSGLYPH